MDRRTAIAYLRQLAPGKDRELQAMLGLLGVTEQEYRQAADSGMAVVLGSGKWSKPPDGLGRVQKITVGGGGGGGGSWVRGAGGSYCARCAERDKEAG